jgi:hypothetical protein
VTSAAEDGIARLAAYSTCRERGLGDWAGFYFGATAEAIPPTSLIFQALLLSMVTL